jgi:hypothetical protein
VSDDQRRQPREEWVYLAQSGEHVKVGRTRNLDERMTALRTGSPFAVVVLRAFRVAADQADKIERAVRREMLVPARGEWVRWQPGIERIADSVVARSSGGLY